ncbi:MAG: 50S ribosomal protein L10 [Kiritimatiellae bacterium]|nr:50S ribosomal protein L10 [Kiritimatiellia bacterium]
MRTEKISILDEVIDRVKGSDYCFILNYGGLKVEQLNALRKELQSVDTRLMVVKNSYLSKTAEMLKWDDVSALLSGQTAVVTGKGDVAEVAKLLVAFVKGSSAEVKGASLEHKVLDADDVVALSKLPSKDIMRAMLLGTMLAPATSLVRVMNAPMLNVLYALKAYEEKKESAA